MNAEPRCVTVTRATGKPHLYRHAGEWKCFVPPRSRMPTWLAENFVGYIKRLNAQSRRDLT